MHVIGRHLFRLVLAGLMLFAPAAAFAACQTSNSTGTFADGSSYTVQANGVGQVVTSAGFTCSGSLITVAGSSYARATVTSARGWRLVGPTGDRIPYVVSADAAGAYSFEQYGTIDYFDASLLSLLTILNGGAFTPRIYLTINGSANVAAGTYQDTLTVQWSWNVCHGIGLGGICILGESGTGTATIPVTIVVAKDCQISAPAVAFGTASLVSQFAEVTQSVLVDCTKGANYNLGFTSGSSPNARPWRTMKSAGGGVLQYNIYRTDGTTIWDESNPLPSALPGTGGTTPNQPFAYKARVNASQATPAAGTYSDTVSVVVSF